MMSAVFKDRAVATADLPRVNVIALPGPELAALLAYLPKLWRRSSVTVRVTQFSHWSDPCR